jgi:nitrous oxide reductase
MKKRIKIESGQTDTGRTGRRRFLKLSAIAGASAAVAAGSGAAQAQGNGPANNRVSESSRRLRRSA